MSFMDTSCTAFRIDRWIDSCSGSARTGERTFSAGVDSALRQRHGSSGRQRQVPPAIVRCGRELPIIAVWKTRFPDASTFAWRSTDAEAGNRKIYFACEQHHAKSVLI